MPVGTNQSERLQIGQKSKVQTVRNRKRLRKIRQQRLKLKMLETCVMRLI
jgi:hypothetical protein